MRITKNLLLFLAGSVLSEPVGNPCTDVDCPINTRIPSLGILNPIIPKPVLSEHSDSPDLRKRVGPLSDAEWNQLVAKGRKLVQDLAAADDEIPSTLLEFDHYKMEIAEGDDDIPKALPGRMERAMVADGLNARQIETFKPFSTKGRGAHLEAFYSSTISAVVITHVTTQPNAPMKMSEILYHSLGEKSRVYCNLDTVYIAGIVNIETTNTMKAAVARNPSNHRDEQDFLPGSDGFYALLATPNGRTVPYMLIDHWSEFQRTIKKIHIDSKVPGVMNIYLE